MGPAFRNAVSVAVLWAACSFSMPVMATPISASPSALFNAETASRQTIPVAARHKAASRSKARKSGVRVAPQDLDADGTPDTVTVKPRTKPVLNKKPTATSKPTQPTGGVYVQ